MTLITGVVIIIAAFMLFGFWGITTIVDTRQRMKRHAAKKALKAAMWRAIFDTTDLRKVAAAEADPQ